GPDGNLWFTEQGDFHNEGAQQAGKIGRMLPHPPYTITEFNTSHPQDRPRPYKIVTGPDRDLYVIETCDHNFPAIASCGGDIGGTGERMTPFGSDARIQASVKQVAQTSTCTAEPCDYLEDIVVGPDHNLWIASANTGIRRLTVPGYHLTEFPVPDGL